MSCAVLDTPIPDVCVRTTLSAALRAGACYHPQGRGAFYRQGKTCALGAIVVGLLGPPMTTLYPERGLVGVPITKVVYEHTGVRLHELMEWRLPGHEQGVWTTLRSAIIYLNDKAHWSREQIADWLAAQGY